MKARKHDPRLPPGYEAEQLADGSVLLRMKRGVFERFVLVLFGIGVMVVFALLLRAEIAYIADKQEVWKNLPSPEKWYGITIFGLTTGALILTVGLVGFTGLWNGLSQDALTLNRNLIVINQWFFAYHRQKRITDAHIVLEYHHSPDDGEFYSLDIVTNNKIRWSLDERCGGFNDRISPQDLIGFGLLLEEATGWSYIIPPDMQKWIA